MRINGLSYRSYDGRHGPKYDFVLTKDSPQAQGLRSWIPLINGRATQMIRGGPALGYAGGGSFAAVIEPTAGIRSHDKPSGTPRPNVGDFGPGETGFGEVTCTLWISKTGDNTDFPKMLSKGHAGDFDTNHTTSSRIWTITKNGGGQNSADQGNAWPDTGTPRFFAIQVGTAIIRLFTDSFIRDLSGDGTWVIDTSTTGAINANANALTVMNRPDADTRRCDGRFWDFRVYDRIMSKAVCESMFYDPWDLYYEIGRVSYHFLGVAAAVVAAAESYIPTWRPRRFN